MKTYRVSNVEAFRKWEADDEADDAAQLIADIVGGGEPSQAMLAGTAFHKVLELAQAGQEVERVEQDGFVFTFKGDIVVPVTPIRELRAAKVYMVDGEPIRISGQVDAIEGLRIEDHKTTARFDPDRFMAGYQWRLYCSIFEAIHFRWNVFEMKEIDDPGPTAGDAETALAPADPFALGPFCYEVFAQHTLEQYRYPTMEADCQALVERFARFVRQHIEAAEPVAA